MPLGFSFDAPDYLTRARAGMPLVDGDGPSPPPLAISAPGGAVAPMAAAPPAPSPAPTQAPPLSKPSFWDIAQGVLFDGQSPAEAAMAARQRQYQAATMGVMAQTLRDASPDERKAMLLNPAELGKAVASRFQSIALKGGETRDFGEGGPASRTAPLLGFDEKSGRGYAVGAGGATSTAGGPLPGEKKADAGLIIDSRLGPTGQTYSLPQIISPGSSGVPFTPSLSGAGSPQPPPTAPTAAGHAAASLGGDGHLDPKAFFQSFVLPHEGGVNPRDLNGAPTKYGFNQTANPDIDVLKLTPQAAAERFAAKNWTQSGAANLPPALAVVHADTSFINPSKAQQFLHDSGGDPNKYMDMRSAWLSGIAQKYPAAQKYAAPWAQRNTDLRALSAQLAGGGGTASGQGFGAPFAQGKEPTPMTPAQREQWGVPANDSRPWMIGVDGKPAPVAEAQYGPKDVREQRTAFYNSPEYQEYTNAVNASNNLETLLHSFTKNTSVLDQAALDNGIRTMTGLSARNQNVVNFTEHLGLPDKVVGAITQKFGNGYLTPAVVMGIRTMIRGYADGHRPAAEARMANETSFAKQYGQDLGATLPQMLPQKPVPWLDAQGRRQGDGGAGPLEVGGVVMGRRYLGGDPHSPQSWGPRQ